MPAKKQPPSASDAMRRAFEPFQTMQSEMARMHAEMTQKFETFWKDAGASTTLPPGANVPAMRPAHPMAVNMFGPMIGLPAADVSESDDAFVITTELPGLDEDDVEVSASGMILTISGEKKQETREERSNYFMSERRFGRFQRTFPMPGNVEADRVSSHFDKGVLTVTLPKAGAPKRAASKAAAES